MVREGEIRRSGEAELRAARKLRHPTRRPWRSLWRRILLLFGDERSGHVVVGTNVVVSGSGCGGGRSSSVAEGFIISPDDWRYVVWTHFILIWATYSSFFTPLEFGFFRGLPKNLFLLDIAGQIVFLIDIIVRFFVAYPDIDSYRMIYSRRLIALRYLKSRFLVDVLGCLPWDAIYKASGREEAVRYMLWIRLSRALRVTEFFHRLEEDIRVNYLFTRIVKLLVVEYYCTHTAACIFYYLATTVPASEEGYTWIGSLQMGDYHYSHFRDIDLWKRYITSLYFAIITMATVGYGDIHAVNVREMIFVMIYVSFDMILGAYLVGNMIALIVRGSKTERFRDKMTDVIKYIKRNNLEKQISSEIKGHLQLQLHCDRTYPEAAILQDVPVSIRTKISQTLYEPFIKEVSLFKGCSPGFIKQIAYRVQEVLFLPGEVIVEEGNVVDQLYIVWKGELEEVGRGEDDEPDKPSMRLQTCCSFGEVSFLCSTPQPYTVRVLDSCQVLRLDKKSFKDIIGIYFLDGGVILDNLLKGKDSTLQNHILESDVTLYIWKHESEIATRLNCAVYHGDFYKLKCLIGAGADPSKTDYDGRSPLHIAAYKGYEDITVFLIQRGVNLNILDNFGNSPMLEAIKHGHRGIASLLAGAGASLTINDAGGFLCMTVAKRDLDLLKRLLASGIDPDVKNYDYRTPLHIAASEGLYVAAKVLVEEGASVLTKDRWGNTPLHEARVSGDKNLIELLEAATASQTIKLLDSDQISGAMGKKKCTVFPFHPWDPKEMKQRGIVVWVPQTMEQLINAAREQLDCPHGSCVLSEDGAKIRDIDMITNDQKLFLVDEAYY